MAIFNSWHSPFLNVPYSPFQKNETLESWHNWLLNNWKEPKTLPQSFKLFKGFLNIIEVLYIYQFPKIGDLMSCVSKDIQKQCHIQTQNDSGQPLWVPKNDQERIFFIIF